MRTTTSATARRCANALLVTGSKDRTGLKAMRDAVAGLIKGPYHLTDALFVYRNGKFVKFGKN